jgi:predicted ATP-dependent serine protease
MARVWVCPQCGTHNSVEATECASCGRWASVFDLERTVEGDGDEAVAAHEEEEWEPVEAAEPEPVVPASGRPTAGEVGRTVLDTIRGGTVDTAEAPEPNRAGTIVKWVVIGLALLWFLLPPLLDALG